MERTVSLAPVQPSPRLRLAFARLLQVIGWAGLAGLGLFALAALVGHVAWQRKAELAQAVAAVRVVPLQTAMPMGETAPPLLKLPGRADIPLLLTRIERAATKSGLLWTAGDYRIAAATDRQAATLEVCCAFKAPYPKLRAMLVALLSSVPAVTFREMSFSRASIDSPDVDARFAIVVFLADELQPPAEGAR